MVTITQLEYILAVDTYRHFGKAADACHVSQPTLSMQIQKVEEEFGFPLFDRQKKPILPTDKGRVFIEQAKALLREHKKLVTIGNSNSGDLTGTFRLGIIPTLAPYLLPLFIDRFSKKYPKVDLTIDELKTDSIAQQLKEDQLDGGILATPLEIKGLTETPLFYEPFQLYLSKNHPLLKKNQIKQDDLDGSEMWLLKDGHCFRNQVVQFCSLRSEPQIYKNIHFEGGTLETLKLLVKKGTGYTLVPYLFSASLDEKERKDVIREFTSPIPTREVSLVVRRDQWKTEILKAIEATILESIPQNLIKKDKKQLLLDIC